MAPPYPAGLRNVPIVDSKSSSAIGKRVFISVEIISCIVAPSGIADMLIGPATSKSIFPLKCHSSIDAFKSSVLALRRA